MNVSQLGRGSKPLLSAAILGAMSLGFGKHLPDWSSWKFSNHYDSKGRKRTVTAAQQKRASLKRKNKLRNK